MKLRNKKTGEIGELQITEKHCAVAVGNGTASCGIVIYNSLAELNDEWEDYEEPKEYWHVFGTNITKTQEGLDELYDKRNREIGNYFETEEEAEKAVEKLKAWKRLKDKGISLHLQKQFRGDGIGYSRTIYTDFTKDSQEIVKDLDLLFGGEE